VPRILFLNKAPPYRGSGAETVIWELGTHLAAHGWDVHYLSPMDLDDADPPNLENVTLHNVPTPDGFLAGRVAFFLKGIGPYRRLIRELDPDIVYDNASPLLFIYAHLVTPSRVVTKVHGINGRAAFEHKSRLPTKVGTMLGDQLYRLKDGSGLLTVSESTRDRLQRLVSKNPDRIRVVRNGIDPDPYEFTFSPEGPVLSLCQLSPRKDLETLLRAWRHVKDAGVERRLIVAGDGPRRDALEELAANLGLRNVEFRGYVPEEEKLRLMREASCYVLPTLMEGFGLSNLEAMASGCVVISTDAPGVRDYLRHEKNGLMFQPGDDGTLATAIRRALDDPEAAESWALRGRETVEELYHIEDTVADERAVLEGLL